MYNVQFTFILVALSRDNFQLVAHSEGWFVFEKGW
jgi:hypothetical protein